VNEETENTEPVDEADTAENPSVEDNSTADDAPQLSLEDQLAAVVAERDANLDRWRRAEAECENVRKRMRREAEEQRKYQAMSLSRDILPVLDNLGRALEAAHQTHNLDQLVEGVELVARQIGDALTKNQVIAIESKGKPFDSDFHEALQQVPTADHPPMTVIDEVERGYTLHDRLVRAARVIVSKAPEE
jgi:molecular chaperone GrpE